MRKICTIMLLALTAFAIFAFAACDNNRTYTITFHSNGGSEVDDMEYTTGSDRFDFPFPNRPGYALDGWFSNESFNGNPVWQLPAGARGDLEYWAKWVVATYNINYNLSGGAVPSESPTGFTMFDEEDTVLPLSATRNGYSFVAWYDNAQLAGEPITVIPKGTYGDQNVYPKWEAVDYTIKFETNGGDTVADMQYNILGITQFPTTERAHYTFGGWYATSDFTGYPVAQLFQGNFGDKTFYAKWIPVSYPIQYELDGGSWPTGMDYPKTYTIEGGEELFSPEKEDMAFIGWYDNPNLDGMPISVIGEGLTDTLILYAKWLRVDFRISYQLDGGSLPAGYPQGYDTDTGITLVNATKRGFNFLGWYDNETFSGNPVTKVEIGQTGNKVFWAKWEKAIYSVTFFVNGGSQVDNFTYDVDSPLQTLPRPTRGGAMFGGWFTNASFTGTAVTEIPANSTGNRTYYAKWNLYDYEVTFMLGGGSLGSAPTKENFTVETSVPLPADPTRTGYTFVGWFNDAAGTMPSNGIEVGTIGNRAIYAVWTANNYSVSFNADGGTMPAGHIQSYTYDVLTILPTPTKSGLDFGGWYETANFSTEKLGTFAPGTLGNKTLYALWLTPITGNPTIVRMEAENTDLRGRSGPGYSGSQSDENRIQNELGASGGKVVGWTLGPGVYIDYEFTLDRTLTNTTLTIGLGSEIGNVTFNPSNLRVYVNGVVVNWGSLTIGGPTNRFGSVSINNLTLLAGKNTVVFEVLNNDLLTGFDAGGPLFDFIEVTARANIGWNPIYY